MPDGWFAMQSRAVHETIYGPVLQWPGVLAPNLENDRALVQWRAINRAGSVEKLKSAVLETLGMPWTNRVASGVQGKALFMNASVVPSPPLGNLSRCVIPDASGKRSAKMVVINGAPPRDGDGVPVWPSGWVGCISRSEDSAVAGAAPSLRVRGLGVDVQALIEDNVVGTTESMVAMPEEMRCLHDVMDRHHISVRGDGSRNQRNLKHHFNSRFYMYKTIKIKVLVVLDYGAICCVED